ncbi:MAG: outer membrane beta-barrel protein [Saprospiraceae bacterium]
MKTKFAILLVPLLFNCGIQLFAQKHSFGIQIGTGISTISLTNSANISKSEKLNSPLFSYSLNVSISNQGKGKSGFSIEPGYIQKGGIQQNDQANQNDNILIKFHYAQLPCSFDWHINEKVKISVGPEFDLLLNSIYLDNNFEISGLAGIQFNAGEGVSLGIRISHGLTSVSEVTYTDVNGMPVSTGKEYNQYLHFLFRFDL